MPQLTAALEEEGREAAFHVRSASMCVAKAWEAAAEEARVRGAQLDACACILEMSVLGESHCWICALAVARRSLVCCAWRQTMLLYCWQRMTPCGYGRAWIQRVAM